jgi:hypothetical protein
MKDAHLRFGWLTYVKVTEKTTTNIKLRLDRFIGELLPDSPRQAKAHLISVIGGDTQIAAVSAAISLGDRFMVEGPGVQPIRISTPQLSQSRNCSFSPFYPAFLISGSPRFIRNPV